MLKVLIVEDSFIIQDRLIKMISLINNTKVVGSANDGVEALVAIQKLMPDLIILDLCMPKANGFDVINNIKDNNLLTTVLVLTNFATEPERKQCMELGIKYFFDKTTEFEQAIEAIETLASTYHAEFAEKIQLPNII
ncbi:MAG: response regulator transcription factor [Bacteroidota bacterium]